MIGITERARRYLARLEPAISGSGGRTATFKAAVALARGFSLEENEALPLLMDWNGACSPPWTEKEILAFLRQAQKSQKAPGYLLEQSSPPPLNDEEEKRRKRRQWPSMRRLSGREILSLVRLRGISVEAVNLINSHHFLWHCRMQDDGDCFVIRNGPQGTFAQRRRLDGEACTMRDGSRKKALNLPGSEGAFLQLGGMGNPDVPLLMTEGAISILEAAEAVLRADYPEPQGLPSLALLAAASASSRFTAEALDRIKGRRVRIYGDADKAGQDAAANWTATLRTVGCTVDHVLPPQGCKDLGEALQLIPARDSYWRKLLTF